MIIFTSVLIQKQWCQSVIQHEQNTQINNSAEEEEEVLNFCCFKMRGNLFIYRQQRIVLINAYGALSEESQLFGKVTTFHKNYNFS